MCLLGTDEIRGLHWAEVNLDGPQPGISITRTMRHSGGTKTEGRRRGLGLPQLAVDALKRHRKAQAAERLAAGKQWENNDLVFCTRLGRPLDRGNVGRIFKTLCANPGIEDAGNRVPYEMRHTYASLIHDDGVPAEEIAQQLGHSGTRNRDLQWQRCGVPVVRLAVEDLHDDDALGSRLLEEVRRYLRRDG